MRSLAARRQPLIFASSVPDVTWPAGIVPLLSHAKRTSAHANENRGRKRETLGSARATHMPGPRQVSPPDSFRGPLWSRPHMCVPALAIGKDGVAGCRRCKLRHIVSRGQRPLWLKAHTAHKRAVRAGALRRRRVAKVERARSARTSAARDQSEKSTRCTLYQEGSRSPE
jgi:hypothetical protein